MWLLGQYQRQSRQSLDEDNWASIRTDVTAIRTALNQLAGAAPQLPLVEPPESALRFVGANETRLAFRAGFTKSALIAAAVELEHALRDFARRYQIVEPGRTPTSKLIHAIRPIVGQSVYGELQHLWRARNLLVHGGAKDQLTEEKQSQLFESFLWAIDFLSEGSVASSPEP